MGVNIHCKGRGAGGEPSGLIDWHRICPSKPVSPGHEVLSEDITQAGITEIIVAGKEYREFTDFFTDLPENSWGIRQTPLTGLGSDMVHWSFGKAELCYL